VSLRLINEFKALHEQRESLGPGPRGLMDFQEQLNNIFKKYPLPEEITAPIKPIPELKVEIHDWRIHKRSLPVGLDKPVMFNLTEEEAKKELKRLKPQLVEYNEEKNIRVVHYYDKVRSDGYLAGVYENPPERTK